MSDPMTRTDIEDVLSSIRRLVSEEARPESSARRAAAEARQAGRLVLTPALRVAGEEDLRRDEPPAKPVRRAPVFESQRSEKISLEDLRLDAAVAWRPETELIEEREVQLPSRGAREADATAPAPAADDAAEDLLVTETASAAIESTIAELEAAVAARIEQWDPDGTEHPVVDENHTDAFGGPVRFFHRGAGLRLATTQADGAAYVPPPLMRPAGPTAGEMLRGAVGDAEEVVPEAPFQEVLQDNVEEPRSPLAFHSARTPRDAVDRQARAVPPQPAEEMSLAEDDAWEDVEAPEAETPPDLALHETGRQGLAGEDHVAEEHLAAQPPAEDPAGRDHAEPTAAEAGPEIVWAGDHVDHDAAATGARWREDEASLSEEAPADSAFLNEEMLRDLVRDMIRQELQGTLGERITRNVRKLVRAEINRALASREFD